MGPVSVPRDHQGELFGDYKSTSLDHQNQANGVVGAFAEEFAAHILGARRYTTVSGHVCPDLEILPPDPHSGRRPIFGEVKAVGPKHMLYMRREQHANYCRLSREGAEVYVILVMHDLSPEQAMTCDTESDLRRRLASCLRMTIVLPWQTFDKQYRLVSQTSKSPAGIWLRKSWVRSLMVNPARLGRERALRSFPCEIMRQSVGYVAFRARRCLLLRPIVEAVDDRIGIHAPAIQWAAGELLADLESSSLEVYVDHETRRRVVANQNAWWYRRLCAEHPVTTRKATRRDYTCIKRGTVISVLQKMRDNKRCARTTEDQLMPYLLERIAEGRTYEYV